MKTIELARLGAEARTRGLTVLDNPFLQRSALPESSGDTIAEWMAKHDAWDAGWKIEDAITPLRRRHSFS